MRDWVEATEAAAAEASAVGGAAPPSEGAALHFLDPDLRIPAYWSSLEADVICDVAAGRGVWEHALQTRYGISLFFSFFLFFFPFFFLLFFFS